MREVMRLMQPDGIHPNAEGVAANRRGHRAGGAGAGRGGPGAAVIRAFAALALPEAVRFDLMLVQQGLPVPRPVPPENLHLTLVFLGEVPEPRLDDVDLAFRPAPRARASRWRSPGSGCSAARSRGPSMSARRDSRRCATCRPRSRPRRAAPASTLPARRFVPHVTLARLPERLAGRGRLEQEVAARGGYAAPRFIVEDFRLYRSRLAAAGAQLRGARALSARLSGVSSSEPARAPQSTSARVTPMSRSMWSSSSPRCARPR